MSTATSKPTGIDTLTVSDDLHKAGFPQPQAKALAHWASQFVTKADLRVAESRLARKIGDVDAKVNGVKDDLNKRMDKLDQDLTKRMDRLEENHKELHTTIGRNLLIMIGAITLAATLTIGAITIAVGVTLWGMDKLLDRALSAATVTIEAPVTESASLIEPSGHEHDENRELSTPH